MSHIRTDRPWLHRALRTLLQADRPIPARTDAEVAAEVQRNYHWNFSISILDNTAFWFGISFISASTIVPLFISKLTPSPLAIGLAAVIAQGGWFLPQLFTANAVERLPRKKPVVVRMGLVLERIPVWFLVAAALLAPRSPTLALVIFLLGYAWRGLGGGAVAIAWQDLIARCFPVDRRGRMFGLGSFLGGAAGAAGAGLSTWLLENLGFPTNFAVMFAIAAASLTLSWFFVSLTREPLQQATAPGRTNRQFLSKLPEIIRQDHNFRRFLIARSTLALGSMGLGFVTVSAIHRWQVADAAVGLYTAAYWVGQTIGTLSFGLLADRFGHKLSLELGALASASAYAMAWLAPTPGWIPAVFVLLGISLGAMLVSGILVSLEFSRPERRPTYVGLANTIVGISNMAAPLFGAWLAGISYSWVFAPGAVINLIALVAMRWWVQEPRWARAVDFHSLENPVMTEPETSPEIEP